MNKCVIRECSNPAVRTRKRCLFHIKERKLRQKLYFDTKTRRWIEIK